MGLFGNRVPRDVRDFMEKTKGTQLMFPNTWALIAGPKLLNNGLPEGSGKLHLLEDGTGFLWKIKSPADMSPISAEIQVATISAWGHLKACPTFSWINQFPSDVDDFLYFRSGPWDFALMANSNWQTEENQTIRNFSDWMGFHYPELQMTEGRN
jgi:hypothetical protein